MFKGMMVKDLSVHFHPVTQRIIVYMITKQFLDV